MELVKTFTGGATEKGISITDRVSSLGFAINDDFNDETITVTLKRDGKKDVVLIPDVKISELSDFACHGEGTWLRTGGTGTIFGFKAIAFIDLTESGGLPLGKKDGDEIIVDFAGLTGANTHSLYQAIDDELAESALVYEKDAVSAPKQLVSRDVGDYGDALILPTANFEKIIKHFDGDTPSITDDKIGIQLDHMRNNDIADIVGNATTLNFGVNENFVVSLEDVLKFQVYTTVTTGYNFVKVSMVPLDEEIETV